MNMELPIQFPREADTIYEEAEAYRRLSPAERFLSLLDLIDFGVALQNQSPQREFALQVQREQEAEWQRIQKELIKRHGH
jgi:hypothetical protein